MGHLFTILILLFYICINNNNLYALFQSDIPLGARPVFKNDSNDLRIYFTGSVGFMMYNRMGNLNTFNYSDNSNRFQQSFQSMGQHLSSISNIYYSIGIGFNSIDSNFRHELEFSIFDITSKSLNANTGNSFTDISKTPNVTTAGNYVNYNDTAVASIGSFTKQIKIMYNLYYNFPQLISINDNVNMDVFFGGGFGVALLNSGIYTGSYYEQNKITESAQTITFNNTLTNNNISTYSNGNSAALVPSFNAIGLSYELAVGTTVDVCSFIAGQIKFKYAVTTRPLVNFKLQSISSDGMSVNVIQFVGFELGLLLKAW